MSLYPAGVLVRPRLLSNHDMNLQKTERENVRYAGIIMWSILLAVYDSYIPENLGSAPQNLPVRAIIPKLRKDLRYQHDKDQKDCNVMHILANVLLCLTRRCFLSENENYIKYLC